MVPGTLKAEGAKDYMTVDVIKARVASIKAIKDDFEVAHGREDGLYLQFIELCAKRTDRIGKLAREILKTQKIDFPRYCA